MKKIKFISLLICIFTICSMLCACSSDDPSRSGEIRDISATELVAQMQTGWNLGNSFDAEGDETAWGNPATTKEMIQAVADKGFNTIRIPITWDGFFGKAPEYKIEEEWLSRVQEVVNYAIDADMFVIIDSHHEESWRIPDNEHIDEVCEIITALWTQIAEKFKDYGDKLVFEGLNEPRIKGGTNEWNGGTQEGRECVDRMNAVFVDAVRKTGGNNEKRLLLITTFASANCETAINNVAIPDDDHIAMSIHAYVPYYFSYNDEKKDLSVWDGSKKNNIDYVMETLKERFIENGIPVIITEYGAVNKSGNDKEVAAWAKDFLETAKEAGIPCIWWDNGYYTEGNELFGIFNRNDLTWYSDTVVDAIMSVYK